MSIIAAHPIRCGCRLCAGRSSGYPVDGCRCAACDDARAQQGLAQRLVGRRVRFAHQRDAPGYQVVLRATSTGLVVLDGWSGEFAPDLFVVVD